MGKAKNQEIHVRLDSALKRDIDRFRRSQESPPSPPEAVRQLLRKALSEGSSQTAGAAP
jgi:hypothetical protein